MVAKNQKFRCCDSRVGQNGSFAGCFGLGYVHYGACSRHWSQKNLRGGRDAWETVRNFKTTDSLYYAYLCFWQQQKSIPYSYACPYSSFHFLLFFARALFLLLLLLLLILLPFILFSRSI